MTELQIYTLPQEFVRYPLHSPEFGMNYVPNCFDLARIAIAGFVDRQTEFGYGDPLLVVNGQVSWENEEHKATLYYGISNPDGKGFHLDGDQWVRYAERVDNGEEELISWYEDESRAILFDEPISYEQSAYDGLVRASRTLYLLDATTE